MQDEREAVTQSSTIAKNFLLTEQVVYRGLASTIFLGVKRGNFLQVGIKVLLKSKIDSAEELALARAEVTIHRAIPPHSNVIRLLDAEETPTAVLLAMPYTPHGDLWTLVRYGQTYCERETRNCAAQMFAGLSHIHNVCNLLHGDIKPHNFLLFRVDGKHAVQLCDFGLATHPDSPWGTVAFRGLRGTSGWFAPEVLEHRDYGKAVDLFAAGLIVFRMLAGYPAFDPPSCCFRSVDFDDRYWCHVGQACKDLLLHLLATDPAERGTAGDVCQHEWISGAPPAEPTAAQLAAVMAYGPPPTTDVLFWPVGEIPEAKRTHSFANLHAMADPDDDMDTA